VNGAPVSRRARIGAAVALRVEDYFVQGRRSWVRLYEKGGKQHQVPAHHNLDEYMEAYIGVYKGCGPARRSQGLEL
jgi:integrase